MENWARKHRRWLWASVCALAVVTVVGFAVRAPVKDWWLAREACGGVLPGADLEAVRSGVRLGAEEESFDEERGRYRCVLESDRGQVVVAVDTYLGGADRDRQMRSIGSSSPPYAVLPGGLPGFEDANSLVYLMPECPGRAKEPYGKHHRLLVGSWTYFAHSPAEKAAMLRLAVRMTNEMTKKLGCGGEPLPAPDEGAVPDRGMYVPRAQAKGTACNALAAARVPEEGADGQVRVAVADGGVVGRCTLYGAGTASAERGRPLVELTSWRGEWAGDMREMGSGPAPLPLGPGASRKPAHSEHRAWAVAECGGENVGFAAHWAEDYHHRAGPDRSGPATEAERQEQRVLLAEYVTAFAKDQVERGNCKGLRVPPTA
ncbi:hypothetical protein [Streptomyces sp. NRRL F-4428]|uniref:hypothetical protein n=1 Tax=Streptomyces sp. NRRL F-4428 TaxID=1609137 RepID=UPI0005EC129D|nr:hypothetical protein [Streptomyces sp. NRRL F-4428]KJK53845.1 hypothetical protein UK14_04845 [Streptomyces sp. NRRL F-4428]